MSYYLRHFFDPDFDYQNRKPAAGKNLSVANLFTLGYVQNVISGQILAEIIPLDQLKTAADKRFIIDKPVFPAGMNTYIDPKFPTYLLSGANGYVFYHDGNITVKSLLNVRQDVSFHTGNIFFVGDMAVYGSVRSGFEVQANNIRIMEMLEGGVARSRNDMLVSGGARGAASSHCLLDAGGRLLAAFLEKVEARAKGNLVIEKYCLYSTVYAGGSMIVREQLYGGITHAYGSVYIGKQAGNKAGIPTQIFLGYDPLSIRHLEKLEKVIANLSNNITHLKAIAGHLPPETNENTRKLQRLLIQREHLITVRENLVERLQQDENTLQNCRLLIPGKIFPGVEIAIGNVFTVVDKPYENVQFRLAENEIIIEPMPPETRRVKKA